MLSNIIKQQKKNNIALFVLIVMTAIVVFTPIINFALPFLFLEVLILFLALSLINKNLNKYFRKLQLFTIIYIVGCVIYKIMGITSPPPGTVILRLFFFFCVFILLMLPKRFTEKQNRRLLFIVMGVMLFNIIDNIRICVMYPEIAALVNRSKDSGITGLNIGEAPFYDAVLFFYSICLFCFFNSKEKGTKRIFLISTIVAATFIFAFCLKASVLVLAVFSTYLLFFSRHSKSLKQFIFRILIPGGMFYVALTSYTEQILDLLSSVVTDERLLERLAYLVDSDNMQSVQGASTMTARQDLWMLSVKTWTQSPMNFLFGIGDHLVKWSSQSVESVGIGQHSDFFDSLARYGLLGTVLILSIIRYGFKYISSLFSKNQRIQLYVLFIMFLIQFVTKNAFHPSLGFLMFVMLPLSAKVIFPSVEPFKK